MATRIRVKPTPVVLKGAEMFLWDEISGTHICFGGADAAAPGVAALLDACTVPIVVHDHARAGILGTGTLLLSEGRRLLLTAAHLFEQATSSGNWLIPERASGQLLCLEGAQVHVLPDADIALVDLTRSRNQLRLLQGRTAIPARLALRERAARRARKAPRDAAPTAARRGAAYCLAGYPAAWSRFERGYLAAKRLTITTLQFDASALDVRCRYGRVAARQDGQCIHTPALEGMSGAAIWELRRTHGASALRLAGVQSAFLHSHYLRGDAASACLPLLRG